MTTCIPKSVFICPRVKLIYDSYFSHGDTQMIRLVLT